MTPSDEKIVEQWLSTLAPSTASYYLVEIFEFAAEESNNLKTIQREEIVKYLDESLSNMTAIMHRRQAAAIKSFFLYAHVNGYRKDNPTAFINQAVKEADRAPPSFLTEDQILNLIRSATDSREYLVLSLSYYAALSSIELSKLTWGDFDNQSVKVGNPLRNIPLPDHLWEYIQRARLDKTDPVFPSRLDGRHLSVRQTSRMLKEITRNNGLENVSNNIFKNSHAQHALSRGASLLAVQKTFGHKRLKTTARHLHSIPAEKDSSLSLPSPKLKKPY